MNISPLFFYLFASLAIALSILVIAKKNPISSAFSLVLVFFAFAGIYALLDAHLIAALQILVYAGAIMVLFLFVIMLLNADVPSFDLGRSHAGMRWISILFGALIFGAFVWAFQNSPQHSSLGIHPVAKINEAGGNTKVISQLMFSEYILPFELTSVLLLAGIVGSVALAKRGARK